MTIASEISEIEYAGDGVSTVFDISFEFDTSADLKVIETTDGNPVVVTTGFSITGGGGSTGTLTRDTALPSGTNLKIIDDPELTQPVDYIDNDAFPAEVHESALDRLTRICKRLSGRLALTARVPDGDPAGGSSMIFPTVAARRGKFAFWADDTTAELEPAVTLPANTPLSQSIIAALLIPQTSLEASAGVTPTNYQYEPGNVLRYGADRTGVANSTTAFQSAARAVNGTSSAGAVPGGKVFVPVGTYLVSRVGMRGTVFEGESMIGTVVKGTGAGSASEFMFDAALDLDASTANTDGQRGYCREMTIKANGSGRSLHRTYGSEVAPERLLLMDAVAAGAIGLSLGLPIMSSPRAIRVINCDIGFFTYSGAADLATSTTFIGCWADACLTDGFRITQLAYSSLINCAAQECGTNNFYFDGSSNGVTAIFSIQIIGCGSEGTGVPFRFEDCREFTIIGPRVIGADVGQDLMILDDFTGSIIDFSIAGALAGGAVHFDVQNHNGGNGTIVVVGGDITFDEAHRLFFTLNGTSANTVRENQATSLTRPRNSQSGNYTLLASDAGKEIFHPGGAGAGDTFTIPANASVPYPVGTEIVFTNREGSALSVAIASDTLVLEGTATTGTRSIAANTCARARKIETTLWVIDNKTGVT